jgi:putative oxidoreductase
MLRGVKLMAMPDIALLHGRLTLVALFLQSGTGKFGELGRIAGALATNGNPGPLLLAGFAAAGELAGALGIAARILTRVSALGLVVFTTLATVFFHNILAAKTPSVSANTCNS